MLMIKAVSFNGQPVTAPLSAEFGEQGGVIGRANGNALVLPDPERLVSRAHASIAFRDGNYVIRDMSSATPVYVNGRPLGNGREVHLQYGDELRIGAYALEVLQGAPSPAAPGPVDDPLDLFGGGGADPFASPPPLAQERPDPMAARPAARVQAGIPDDFDPFADFPPSPQARAAAGAPADLPDDFHLGLGQASSTDINQLFGLGASPGGLFPDGHPLAEGGGQAAFLHSSDPLVVLGARAAPAPGANSQRDNTPEIYGSFVPPIISKGNEQRGTGGNGSVGIEDQSQKMFVSWDAAIEREGEGIKTMVVQSPSRPQEARPRQMEQPAETPAVRAAAPATASTAEVAEGDLLKAFLEGAGVPDLEMGAALTPEMMAMFGQLLRESTKGTLDLLMARALTKREMHAQMTVIAMRENNPLKFSPNVEVALHSLLAPRGKGFMPPLQAMKDAYDDLRAHQFGVMAGMRAALARVLQRFDPEQLEERLTDRTLADSLLPAHRKARLWAQYLALYKDITKEAEDDFQTWFGREFLSAYEAQMTKLKEDKS